ncbi:MAG TPA: glycosyltransferase [Candidatus Thalassarchaeaceae archaeon]|nr:glycosyltransferase [Candidatus Thalassarchaeaceae archaeon]
MKFESNRLRLVVAKGTFGSMGGAERDMIRVLPALNEIFEVKMATIQPSIELEEVCARNKIPLILPKKNWEMGSGSISTILDSDRSTASAAWATCEGLQEALAGADALHLASGDGSLPLIDHLTDELRVHLLMHEPHRGLYEDTLHRTVDGSPKRNPRLSRLLLSRARRRDRGLIGKLTSRENSKISGNSSFSAKRTKEVYGVNAGVLWPCVDTSEFPQDSSDDVENPFDGNGEYVVCIGRATWAKGTWEAISMLSGTGLSLAHVGGGEEVAIERIKSHAHDCGVELWVAPRLDSPELVSLMRSSTAIISMAHRESFGLTPIEAFSVGTPAIFVDEGGFKDTIVDGENGRLVSRDDIAAWHGALKEAKDESIRNKWIMAGRSRLKELDLSPKAHARRLFSILS